MAFKKKVEKAVETAKTNHQAICTIIGVITDIFEGAKKNYATVRIDTDNINPNTNKPYYNTMSIGFDKSVELPADECEVTITGEIRTFFDKDRQRTETYIDGKTCVSNQ